MRRVFGWLLRLVAYVFGSAVYIAGVAAFFVSFQGLVQLAGIIPGTFLLLPLVGKGTLLGVPVRGFYWWIAALAMSALYFIASWWIPETMIKDYARKDWDVPRWAEKRFEATAIEEWRRGRCYSCRSSVDRTQWFCLNCGAPAPPAALD